MKNINLADIKSYINKKYGKLTDEIAAYTSCSYPPIMERWVFMFAKLPWRTRMKTGWRFIKTGLKIIIFNVAYIELREKRKK